MSAPEEVVEVSEYPLLIARVWPSRPWRANALLRGSDRIQAVVGMFAIAIMLLAVPLAGAVGTASYTAAAERIRIDRESKAEVTATVVAKPTEITVTDEHGVAVSGFEAAVAWDVGGRSGTAVVAVPGRSTVGDTVTMWFGADGKPAAPPRASSAGVSSGIGGGVGFLAGIWSAAILVMWGSARMLDATRNAAWGREWRNRSEPIAKNW